MKDIRKFPIPDDERVETGPVQFGDDWPGVFIRGDEACWIGHLLSQICEILKGEVDFITRSNIEGFARMLSSCRVTFEDEEPVEMEKWDPDENSVYYRILSSDDGLPIVVQMQWVDEHGVDHDRYLTDERFETEEEAEEIIRTGDLEG